MESPTAKRSGACGTIDAIPMPITSASAASAMRLASVHARSPAGAHRIETPAHTASPATPPMASSAGPDLGAARSRDLMSAHAANGAATSVASMAAVAPRVARPSPRSMPPLSTVSTVQAASSTAPAMIGPRARATAPVSACSRARLRSPG